MILSLMASGMVLHTEFRDGNVPSGYEQLRVFEEALGALPEGEKRVRMRSDTAGGISMSY